MESIAKKYLSNNGLRIIAQNYHCRFGELDIIAKENKEYIFVEVKYRKNGDFGGAISAVSSSKQEKIKKTARFFMQLHLLNEYNTQCRFDIVALEGDISQPDITWLPNAF